MGCNLQRADVLILLNYNPETGDFTRLIPTPGYTVGQVAGCKTGRGYIRIKIWNSSYLAHRLAWLVVHGYWPTTDVDHINRIRSDNRIANLRLASRAQNICNSEPSVLNKSGFRGVHFCQVHRYWIAQIVVEGRKETLGRFRSRFEAARAYLRRSKEVYGDFVPDEAADIPQGNEVDTRCRGTVKGWAARDLATRDNKIVSLVRSGIHKKAIAAELGCALSTVYNVIQKSHSVGGSL